MAFDNEELKQLEDLNKKVVKDVVTGVVTGALMQFWDEVLEPNMVVKKDLEDAEKRIKEETAQKIMKESQDTRDYIDKRIREYSGETVGRDKTIVLKADTTADRLGERNVFPPETVTEIKSISPFPLAPAVEQL